MPKNFPEPTTAVQPDKSLEDWRIFPDTLPNGRFRGFENRDDPSLLRGAWILGQNVTFARTAMPSPRKGYEVIGTEATDATPIQRAWVVETPNGDTFELKAYDDKIMYWLIYGRRKNTHYLSQGNLIKKIRS